MSTVGTHLSNSVNRVSKRFLRLAKIIVVALVVIAGILAFDFLILWITSGKFLERLPI
jgi:hypothetical protein